GPQNGPRSERPPRRIRRSSVLRLDRTAGRPFSPIARRKTGVFRRPLRGEVRPLTPALSPQAGRGGSDAAVPVPNAYRGFATERQSAGGASVGISRRTEVSGRTNVDPMRGVAQSQIRKLVEIRGSEAEELPAQRVFVQAFSINDFPMQPVLVEVRL